MSNGSELAHGVIPLADRAGDPRGGIWRHEGRSHRAHSGQRFARLRQLRLCPGNIRLDGVIFLVIEQPQQRNAHEQARRVAGGFGDVMGNDVPLERRRQLVEAMVERGDRQYARWRQGVQRVQRQRQLLCDRLDVAPEMRRDRMPLAIATAPQAHLKGSARRRIARKRGPPWFGRHVGQMRLWEARIERREVALSGDLQ